MVKESDGKHFDPNTGKYEPIYCPANGWDCPYYENGICYIRNPMEDCDDWGMFWDSWEEWENSQFSLTRPARDLTNILLDFLWKLWYYIYRK